MTDEQLIDYKDCVDDRYHLSFEYEFINYNIGASYSNLESLLFINNTRNMKAYMNYKFFLYDIPLVEDSQIYDQEECNKFLCEDAINSCKITKPFMEIFFEADNSNNSLLFNQKIIDNIMDKGILRYVENVTFVPFGTRLLLNNYH